MASELTFRWFHESRDDYDLFCAWCAGHKREPLPPEYLPEVGLVVCEDGEPVTMIWLYFDASTPTCFAERAINRPGLSVRDASRALCFAIEIAKKCALGKGADLMLLRTPKGMARYAINHLGFNVEEQEVVNLCFHLMREEDLCRGHQ